MCYDVLYRFLEKSDFCKFGHIRGFARTMTICKHICTHTDTLPHTLLLAINNTIQICGHSSQRVTFTCVVAFEMKYCRWAFQIIWQQKVTNIVIRNRYRSKRNLAQIVMARKENMFGHIGRITDNGSVIIILFRKMDVIGKSVKVRSRYTVWVKKVAPPLKFFGIFLLVVNLCKWKLPWLLPKHIPMFIPSLFNLSE